MKCIILAGGYAKRMWPLTEEQAKALLPVNGRPIIDFIVEKVDELPDVDEIIISTNERFAGDFENYVLSVNGKYEKPIHIVAEPSMNEGEKLGAIGGIAFVIDSLRIADDTMIISGDNLSGIHLDDFVRHYKQKPLIAVYKEDDLEIVKRTSCVEMDEDEKIISFEEKPQNPPSNYMSVGFYIYPQNLLGMFKKYISLGKNKDAPGYFLQWLHKIIDVYGYCFSDYWYDIGSFEIYEKVQKMSL